MGPPLAGTERVLVRLPAWLGDFVMAEPLVRALHERLARGSLTLVGRGAELVLFEGRFPRAQRLDADARPSAPNATSTRGAAWRGHDVAFLCTGSWRSAWRAFAARIPRRVGFARDGRAILLTDALVPARERGGVPLGLGRAGRWPRHLPRPLERSLAELAALVGVTVRDPSPRLEPRPAWSARAAERRLALGLAEGEPFLVANVGARAGSAKGYPPAAWARVLDGLADDVPVLLVGGPGEEPAVRAVCDGVRGSRVHALVEPVADLTELAAHCAAARAVLTADSGPRHVARAVGAPVVVVAGPTDPRHTAGRHTRERLVRVTVPCGPCHEERCPLGGAEHLRCMHEVAPERVGEALAALLR